MCAGVSLQNAGQSFYTVRAHECYALSLVFNRMVFLCRIMIETGDESSAFF